MTCLLDSGVGGLCALKELLRLCPDEDFVYLADTAHLPYGCRSRGDICRFTAEALCFFSSLGAERVLLACGTASALALDFCQRSFPFPVHGVTEYAAFATANATKSLHIGVAATKSTVESGIYTESIRAFNPAAHVSEVACPALVTLAEEGGADKEALYAALSACLSPLRDKKIDTLLLGCTHFSLLKDGFAAFFPGVKLIDGAREAAEGIAETFYPPKKKKKRSLRLFSTKDPHAFARRAEAILGERARAEKAPLYTD